MTSNAGPCKTVGQGGVGESGASSQVVHQVTGQTPQLMVLKTTKTSLCGNTGAIAILTVDGEPKAHGNITANGASIQAEAAPGQYVAATVHTVPLFNGIMCVRLGELHFSLEQCELVG